jgi:hypothetical protein
MTKTFGAIAATLDQYLTYMPSRPPPPPLPLSLQYRKKEEGQKRKKIYDEKDGSTRQYSTVKAVSETTNR